MSSSVVKLRTNTSQGSIPCLPRVGGNKITAYKQVNYEYTFGSTLFLGGEWGIGKNNKYVDYEYIFGSTLFLGRGWKIGENNYVLFSHSYLLEYLSV